MFLSISRTFLLHHILMLFTLLFIFSFADATEKNAAPYVLVSVAPHKYFVEKIAGDTVRVGLIVPAGASAHTFEPTPRQMLEASQADIWFKIGESFETKALAALQCHHPQLDPVDLREGVDLIFSQGHCCCCHSSGGMDLHFWLSLRQAKIQAKTIANALIRHYPENKEYYLNSLNDFISELDTMDHEITSILEPLKNRMLLVSHPAYAFLP